MPQFTASDGAPISYEDCGSGRPLLLLHGLMAHGGFFERQRPLSGDFRLISIDLRGHGASRRPGEAVTLERLAEDVATLLDTLDLEQAIGVGWSLGATLLWRVLAGASGRRFAGAVAVDMTPKVLNEGDWQLGLSREVCDARTAAIRDDFESFAQAAGAAIFAQPVAPPLQALADWSGAEFARNDPATMLTLWLSLVGEDVRGLLAGIAQPTLVVHGAQSQLYGPGTADYLVAALPDARALSFARSGHAPHLEQPELFNAALRDFAASLPRVAATQNLN